MRLHKSNEHQLWRISLIVGVSEHSVTESGLDCVLDAIRTHTSLVVVSSDEDKLTIMSEASWQSITRDPFASEGVVIVAGDESGYDKPKRVRGEARKASERWGKLDHATLKQMHKQGKSIAEIADRLGRTPSSIRNQVQLQKGN